MIIKGNPSADMSKNKAIALYDLNDNLNEIESKNLVSNVKYSDKVKEMLATYEGLRTTGAATVKTTN
ncbi:hypothetical protein SLW70_15860 [Flavobacterium sp. NG2]|uniref:hypothetical protein n=1 Tax=Flavobacterium sp. NG2 TaxID=3097547 RepID=UPI002A83BE09|nr:hypothetical protein [Flavobacterium sp. NG2]WPR71390.1 hypothetical protein SLW70_15860 [Flavobacterium sp. NG2]